MGQRRPAAAPAESPRSAPLPLAAAGQRLFRWAFQCLEPVEFAPEVLYPPNGGADRECRLHGRGTSRFGTGRTQHRGVSDSRRDPWICDVDLYAGAAHLARLRATV